MDVMTLTMPVRDGHLSVALRDKVDAAAGVSKVLIYADEKEIRIAFPGYGEKSALPGFGCPVVIEYQNGVPHVKVFDDIEKDDPTEICLLKASEEHGTGGS